MLEQARLGFLIRQDFGVLGAEEHQRVVRIIGDT